MSSVQFRALWEAEWLDYNELPVYEFDRAVHVTTEPVEYQRVLPLEVGCDFNVDPMAWVIGQHHQEHAWALEEISIPGGANTQDACNELIRRYPDGETDVVIYGDASGSARKTSASQTDYDIIRSILGDYYRSLRLCVPKSNPAVGDRVNAVNALLKPAHGTPRYSVSPKCLGLIDDLARVSWKPGTRDIDKSDKTLTHFSDAEGYRLASLFPVVAAGEVFAFNPLSEDRMGDKIIGARW